MLALRVAGLAVLYFVCFAAVAAVLLPPAPGTPAPDPVSAACSLLVMTASNSIVIAYVVRRSRWSGWPLAAALWVVLYGVTTVMPQIETAYFVTRLPAGMLPRLFLSGAIVAAVVSPLAAMLLGRWRRGATGESSWLGLSAREWIVRLSIVVVAYLVLYFGFGYYVAWKSDAVRAYYGGVDPGSFVTQLRTVVRDTPLLVPLQVIRALLPNPYMPQDVRLTHLVETASSNFVFGWVLVAALLWRRAGTTMYVAPASAA